MSEAPPTYHVKFYGTRGSIPVCDSGFQVFGGNTTCIRIKGSDPDTLGIIDAGTGIRKLGLELMQSSEPLPKHIMIGFTHFHWDHIQGFPFFNPGYDPDVRISIVALGENRNVSDLKAIFEMQMRSEFFPVPLGDMGAQFEFDLPNKAFDLFANTEVTAIPHQHPGGAYSYKLEQEGKKIVICTDIEHGVELDDRIIEFARDADLLVHDAQYTSEELLSHKGWGHSSYDQAIEFAERANVKKLIMTHHDPTHDDAFLGNMELQCQHRFPNCFLAREGMEVQV